MVALLVEEGGEGLRRGTGILGWGDAGASTAGSGAAAAAG